MNDVYDNHSDYYKQKYLKYKMKYNELKNINGGGNGSLANVGKKMIKSAKKGLSSVTKGLSGVKNIANKFSTKKSTSTSKSTSTESTKNDKTVIQINKEDIDKLKKLINESQNILNKFN